MVSSQESGVSSVSADEGVGNLWKRLFVHGSENEVEDYGGMLKSLYCSLVAEEMATRVYARTRTLSKSLEPKTRRLRALNGEALDLNSRF